MASFTSLPSELLTYILHLSNAGETAQEEQRSRLAFGLVARAFYLATAGSTSFCVAGDAQSQALFAKLEEVKNPAPGQPRPSGRGVLDVRQLSVALPTAQSGDLLADLLQETPNLVELELSLYSYSLHSTVPPTGPALPAALVSLVNLRELRFRSEPHPLTYAQGYYSTEGLMRLLLSLPALEVLILDHKLTDRGPTTVQRHPFMRELYDQLALPRLRKVSLSIDPREVVAAVLTGSTPRVLEIDGNTRPAPEYIGTPLALLPSISTIVDFTWTFDPTPEFQSDRDEKCALIGAMKSLERIQIPLWTVTGAEFDRDGYWIADTDDSLLDTLATLPLLHTVKLIDQIGTLHDKQIISFIQSLATLRTLSIVVKDADGWTQDQIERVCAVVVDAGVAFSYRTEWK
ncbi:hypothetical protein RQP46_004692 [Phenoliferia psychrophenolica]